MNKNQSILRLLDKSGLTFAELCARLNESRENVRKTMTALHKDGRVSRTSDVDGIVHYTITDKGRAMLTVALLSALVFGPNGGATYIQDMGINGYNIWSSEGITQVRDFQGFEQIVEPNGETTTIYNLDGGVTPVPVLPVLEIE